MPFDPIAYTLAKKSLAKSISWEDVKNKLKEEGALNKAYDSNVDGIVDLDKIPNIPETKLDFSTWKVVYQTTLDTNVSYITIKGLDINKDKYYVLFGFIKNYLDSNRWIYIFAKDDNTLSNYKYIHHSISFDGSNVVESKNVGDQPLAIYLRAKEACSFVSFITKDPKGYFRVITIENYDYNNYPAIFYSFIYDTNPVDNVTEIIIGDHPTYPSLDAGSTFILCKPRT